MSDEGVSNLHIDALFAAMERPEFRLNDPELSMIINIEEPTDGIFRNPAMILGSVIIEPVAGLVDFGHHGIKIKLIKRAVAGEYEIADSVMVVKNHISPFILKTLMFPFQFNGGLFENGTFACIPNEISNSPSVSLRYFVQAILEMRDGARLLTEREILVSVTLDPDLDLDVVNPVLSLEAGVENVLGVRLVFPRTMNDVGNVLQCELHYTAMPSPFVMHRTLCLELHQVFSTLQVSYEVDEIFGDVTVASFCLTLEVDDLDDTLGLVEPLEFDLSPLGLVPTITEDSFSIHYYLRLVHVWGDDDSSEVLAQTGIIFYRAA